MYAILMLVTCGADGGPVLCHVLYLCYINCMAAGSRFRTDVSQVDELVARRPACSPLVLFGTSVRVDLHDRRVG